MNTHLIKNLRCPLIGKQHQLPKRTFIAYFFEQVIYISGEVNIISILGHKLYAEIILSPIKSRTMRWFFEFYFMEIEVEKSYKELIERSCYLSGCKASQQRDLEHLLLSNPIWIHFIILACLSPVLPLPWTRDIFCEYFRFILLPSLFYPFIILCLWNN